MHFPPAKLLTKPLILESFSFLISITDYFSHVFLAINTQGTTFLIITLIVLLLIAFTISGAEVALFSLQKRDINMLKTKQHASAKRIVNLLDEPKEVYASLLIASTFANICIVVLSNYLLNEFISFKSLSIFLQLLLKGLAIAFVLVFICRILPKVWAAQNNLRFAYGSSMVVELLHLLLRRISKWIVKLADRIGKGAGAGKTEAMSMQELDEAIDIKTDEEASPEEKNIMKGIVKFGNIAVKQIMRSRLDVSGLDYNWSFGEITRKVEELHYSRLPVYKNSLDEITGIVNTKDLIPYLNHPDDFDWHSLIRPPYFVPEPKLIEDLLKDFQQKRIHFAVVVDEFGGTSGIVTMEDILEEVIGDIKDEFDEEETGNKKLNDNEYTFEGRTMIHDVCKMMKLPMDFFDDKRGESDSLAGLVLELAGEFPPENSIVAYKDFTFTVLQTEHNRIKQVKVNINPKTQQ